MSKSIDWTFIHESEGYWLEGYVPNSPSRDGTIRSGVTILFGFDLGQQSEAVIRGLPISAELKQRLLPYVGKRGAAAVMALQNGFEQGLNVLSALNGQSWRQSVTAPQPVKGDRHGPIRATRPGEKATQFVAREAALPGLRLTRAEADELAPAVQALYHRRLVAAYNDATRGPDFERLPADTQTALMSLSWHCGSIWARKPSHPARQVFDAAARGDWADAVDTLRGEPFPRLCDRARRCKEAALIVSGQGLDPWASGPKARHWNETVVGKGAARARTA